MKGLTQSQVDNFLKQYGPNVISEPPKKSILIKLIETINLEINEAALTGESLAVEKKLEEEIYSGTIVARGRGLMKVVLTGDSTKFGTIAKNLSIIEEG